MALDDYAEQIVRPMVLREIASGRLDTVLFDADCLEIILGDQELINAFVIRLQSLKAKQ